MNAHIYVCSIIINLCRSQPVEMNPMQSLSYILQNNIIIVSVYFLQGLWTLDFHPIIIIINT